MFDPITNLNDTITNFEFEKPSHRKDPENNHTLILSNDEHHNWTVPCTQNYHFMGLAGTVIRGPLPKSRGDLIFENIIFKNSANQSLDFYGNHIFRNCEFHIHINEMSKLRYGIHINGGSALFQNCIFRMTIRNVNIFVAFGVDHGAPGIILQAPLIDIKYHNVAKLETFYINSRLTSGFHSESVVGEAMCYCESYSGIIYYTNDQSGSYDGHCCQKRCNKKHCTKINCKCKAIHSCCSRKCRKLTEIRLFRGRGNIITSFQSQTIHLNRGNGFFNIAHGDTLVYINGLTVISTNSNWEVGKFHNILLASFVSNLKYASEIVETHCLKHGSETSSTPSGSLLPMYISKPD